MNYDGGKNAPGVIHAIGREIPPHIIRVELFGGSFPLLRLVKPAHLSIGLEIDPLVYAAATANPALKACHLLNCDARSWLRGTFPEQFSLPGVPIEPTPAYNRFPLMVEGRRCARDEVFIYADPPYLGSTRTSQRPLYRHEMMREAEHTELLELLNALPCYVMLSGYPSPLYDQTLQAPKWRRVTFTAYDRQRRPRTEALWMNYPAPAVLHDASFAGLNHRQRWNLTKRKRSWTRKLAAMTPHERQAIREALEAVEASSDAGNGGEISRAAESVVDAGKGGAVPSDLLLFTLRPEN